MTIRFANSNQLKILIERVGAGNANSLNAENCLLLTQSDHNLTIATTQELGKAIFQRYFRHEDPDAGGDAGEMYLLDQSDFRTKLTKAQKATAGSVTLQVQRGTLKLLTDYAIGPDGKPKEKGKLSLTQYGGAITDFPAPFKPQHKIATLNAKHFNQWVLLLNEFGVFTEKPGDTITRTVYLQIGPVLTGFTNYKGMLSAYLEVTAPLSEASETTYDLAIEGRFLRRLVGLGEETIEIYLDRFGASEPEDPEEEDLDGEETNLPRWITFVGSYGRMSFRVRDLDERTRIDYNFMHSTQIELVSQRLSALNDLISGVQLQMPSDTDLIQNLVLLERPPYLVVLHAANVKGTELANVPVDPMSGDWTAVMVNAPSFAAMLKSQQTAFRLAKTTESGSRLEQCRLTRKSGTQAWMLRLAQASEAEVITQSYVLLSPADTVGDLLEVDE